MENPRPEKVVVVDEVRERFAASDAAILTEYRGLNVTAMGELRRALRAAGGDYKIYKNTLVRLAVSDIDIEGIADLLVGPTAIAFVVGTEDVPADPAAVAKALKDFGRTNEHLVVKGGLLGGKLLSAQETRALADLPSRELLLAQLAGGLQAPLTKTARLLGALPQKFAYALNALIDQGGEPDAGETVPTGETRASGETEATAQTEATDETEASDETEATDETGTETPVAESEATEQTEDEES